MMLATSRQMYPSRTIQKENVPSRESRGRNRSRKEKPNTVDCGSFDCVREQVCRVDVKRLFRRTPSPACQRVLTKRDLSPVPPRNTHSYEQCDAGSAAGKELYFVHDRKHIMLGVTVDTFVGPLGVIRHIIYLSSGKHGSLAKDLDLQNGDELLVVGDKPVVGKSEHELLKTCIQVDVSNKITLITRRRPEKPENDEDYWYITVTAQLMFDDVEERVVAKRESLLKSAYPMISDVEYDFSSEVIRISPVYGSDYYLLAEDGQLRVPSDDALDSRDVWVFKRHHYTGIHSIRGRVHFCTIQHGDCFICVQEDNTLGLKAISADMTCPQCNPDLMSQFLIEGHTNSTSFESVKYQGKFVKYTEVDNKPLALEAMANNTDDRFKFKLEIEKVYEEVCSHVEDMTGWASRTVDTVSSFFTRTLDFITNRP